MTLMDEAAVSYQGVLTKADKPKAAELAAIAAKVHASSVAALASDAPKRPAA